MTILESQVVTILLPAEVMWLKQGMSWAQNYAFLYLAGLRNCVKTERWVYLMLFNWSQNIQHYKHFFTYSHSNNTLYKHVTILIYDIQIALFVPVWILVNMCRSFWHFGSQCMKLNSLLSCKGMLLKSQCQEGRKIAVLSWNVTQKLICSC